MRYLLDTNIVIYVLKRRPPEVLTVFNANASRMGISSITLAGGASPGRTLRDWGVAAWTMIAE